MFHNIGWVLLAVLIVGLDCFVKSLVARWKREEYLSDRDPHRPRHRDVSARQLRIDFAVLEAMELDFGKFLANKHRQKLWLRNKLISEGKLPFR